MESAIGYRSRIQYNQTKPLQVSGTTQYWSQLQPNPHLHLTKQDIPLEVLSSSPTYNSDAFSTDTSKCCTVKIKWGQKNLTSRFCVLAGRGQCVNIQHLNTQIWFLRSLGWCRKIWWETVTLAQETEGDGADFLTVTTQKGQSKKRELFLKDLFKLRLSLTKKCKYLSQVYSWKVFFSHRNKQSLSLEHVIQHNRYKLLVIF